MKRRVTNLIRFLMDECLPPAIRDNRYFMYPFFYVAYRGRNVRMAMDFKRLVHRLSEREYAAFYDGLDTISRHRETDLSEASVRFMLERLHPQARSVIDVGCGRGHFLRRLADRAVTRVGCDIVDTGDARAYPFVRASVERLPFRDQQFDVVVCSHTLEHILHVERAARELERVARRQVIVVVPRQRPYYYTLDEHLNFFLYEEQLVSLFRFRRAACHRIGGDWVYVGSPD